MTPTITQAASDLSDAPSFLLLDTHTFLWLALAPARLSTHAVRALVNPEANRAVSIASFWEMAIKAATGQLPQAANLFSLEALCAQQGISVWPITMAATDLVSRMPFPLVNGREHRDPFDRIIIATAQAERMTIVSADAAFDAYAIHRLWE